MSSSKTMDTSRTNSPPTIVPPTALSSNPSSPYYTPIALPTVRLSKFARDNSALRSHVDLQTLPIQRAQSAPPPRTSPLPQLPAFDEPRPHIPRPPNAFMLYRSDFLKNRVVPQFAEKRQQQLSRVVGECWNLLSATEKKYWHDQAAERLREHQQKYPDYKFTPAPRGSSRKNKGKADEESVAADNERIRTLRETFTDLRGPAVAPARRRKGKQRLHVLEKNEDAEESDSSMKTVMNAARIPLPPSITPSPMPSPSVSARNVEPVLPPLFPEPSYPHMSGVQQIYSAGPSSKPLLTSGHPFPQISSPVLASSSSAPSSNCELARQMRELDATMAPAANSYPSPAISSSAGPRDLWYMPSDSFEVPGQDQLNALSRYALNDGKDVSARGPPLGVPDQAFLSSIFQSSNSFELSSFDFPFNLGAEHMNASEWSFAGDMSSSSA